MPGIDDDLAPAAVADVEDAGTSQPARATRARPGSIARRAGRRSSGTRVEQGRELAGEPLRGRDRLVERQDREPAADVERVERRRACRARRPDDGEPAPDRVAPRIDGASCEPTCRWTPRGRTAPSACVVIHSTRPVASVSVMPNLDVPSPTASPAIVSGVTSGLSRTRTSSGGRPRRARDRRDGPSRSGPRPRRRIPGRPTAAAEPARGRADGGPQVGVGLAHALEGDPVVGDARPAGDRPLAARDDVGAEPARGTSATIAGTSLALTEYWRSHGSGNADAHGRCGPVQRRPGR